MAEKTKVIQTLCRMCDEHCGINVYLKEGKIVDIDGYSGHPWNKGRTCSKARAAVDMIYHPDRIKKPLKKTEYGWEEIELEQALDEIAEKIVKIKDEYGARSMSYWKGEATGFAQQEDMVRRFCHAFGTPNYFSNDTACWVGKYIGYSLGYGQWQQPDFANASCIVIWGSNPPYSQSMLTREIMEGREKGAKMIVVDPRMSAIARRTDIHASLMPGTDGALALGVANILIKNNWYDKDFVEKYTVGFEKFSKYVKNFSLEFVEKETGVPAETIKKMALLMYKSMPRVAFFAGNGLEHHINGVNNVRAVSCLDALCGSLDKKGGNLLLEGPNLRKLTLYDEVPLRHLGPIGSDKYPVFYDFRQECHTMMGMDVILSGEPYPLRGMVMTAANPVLTNPNSLKVIKALKSLDLFVVRDLFMTETAELANYVLPAASFLERSELHCHAKIQTINLTKKIVSFSDCQDEYQFWHELAKRLGIEKYFPWKNENELNKWLIEPTGITLEELAEHPEGIQYKPRRYCKWEKEPLETPSGKVEIASDYLKKLGYPELPEYNSPDYIANPEKEYPYVMTTGARKVLFVHGKFHNIPRFCTAIPNPEVELNPQDAEIIGVNDGDMVKITSRVGSINIPVKIKCENEIISGVCQVTHGWKEANVNEITPDDKFDPIDGFPMLKSVPVRIEKL